MVREEMTSRERVLAVFHGTPYDKIPVINPTSLATVESMRHTKAFFPFAHTDSHAMAALASAGHDLFGFDSVMPYFSVHLEAAALGCEIDWGKLDRMPQILKPVLAEPDDFVMPVNFLDRKPIKALLQAIKILRKKYGSEVAIIGKVVGPWTLAFLLHGTANLILKTNIEPDKVHQFLAVLMQTSIEFAHAQFEAGADILTWADHATADLISAKIYEEFLLPVHQQCNKILHKAGPVIFHACGPVTDRLELFCHAGFEAFHLESRNDIKEALQIVNGRIVITGNVNNPNILLNGTVADVRNAVDSVLEGGIQLLSPECALPCWVPSRNLLEIVNAARAQRNNYT
jgi:MtaA/CmuA family methyltransferase